MEEDFSAAAAYVALALETMTIVAVAVGAAETLIRIVGHLASRGQAPWDRRGVWLDFAGWILLSLEFALGADIIRTAIAPSWDDIGKLGAIALIRTGLGFFLGRDMESMAELAVARPQSHQAPEP